jgi:hypothetical protein
LITVHKRHSFRKSLGLFLQSLRIVSKCQSKFGGFIVSFLTASFHNIQDEPTAVHTNPYLAMNHHTGPWFTIFTNADDKFPLPANRLNCSPLLTVPVLSSACFKITNTVTPVTPVARQRPRSMPRCISRTVS